MTTPTWQPGTLTVPGALVVPQTLPTPQAAAIANPGFESGDTAWTKGTGWEIGAYGGSNKFQGTNSARFNGTSAADLESTSLGLVTPGQQITASCMINVATGLGSDVSARCVLVWLSAADAFVGETLGDEITHGPAGNWQKSEASGAAPAGAAKVKVACRATIFSGSGGVYADNFTWNHSAPQLSEALVYRAIQAESATTGATEPAWPVVAGLTVVDGGVTWEATQGSRVTWQASPILRSGLIEPQWPSVVGASVADNLIRWECEALNITDPNCPNSIAVVIMASKVFAPDGDIIRFCMTANPLNWTLPQDAGFLPSGLQQSNANDMAVLAPYRGNLAAFNASSFQNWQVDPDPAAMALLDQMDGIGSTHPKAAVAVGEELVFLSTLGVRTVSISGGNESLSAGDVGLPVDPLVQEAMAFADANGIEPFATYYPSLGQYLLAFPGYPSEVGQEKTTVFVYTTGGGGRAGTWARWVFPFVITNFALFGNELWLRYGDTLAKMDSSIAYDEMSVGGEQVPFGGVVQWNWLDLGPVGATKHMAGFDLVSKGAPSFAVGYDQRNAAAFTPDYSVDADTMAGGMIPLEVVAPSFSFRVTFAPGQRWSLSSLKISVATLGNGP